MVCMMTQMFRTFISFISSAIHRLLWISGILTKRERKALCGDNICPLFFYDPISVPKPFIIFSRFSMGNFCYNCWAILIFSHTVPQQSLVYVTPKMNFFTYTVNHIAAITEIQYQRLPLEVAEEVTLIFNHTDPQQSLVRLHKTMNRIFHVSHKSLHWSCWNLIWETSTNFHFIISIPKQV